MRAIARINRYGERGRARAKLYLSPKAFSVLGSGRVSLVFNGILFKTSASRASRRVGAGKLYLPKAVCERLRGEGAEGAVIEVSGGRVEILRPVRFCRICGEPTAAPDGLCQGRHFNKDGVCVRCGSDSFEKRALCDECVRVYASLCGLSEWLEPSPKPEPLLEPWRSRRSKGRIHDRLDKP